MLLGEHGARVERCDRGWEIGLHEVRHDAAFARCFPGLVRPTTAYQFLHLDHVVVKTALPPGWMSVGASNLCPLQGLYQPGRVLTYQVRRSHCPRGPLPCLSDLPALQGHPEFDSLVVRDIVSRLGRVGTVAADMYEEALALQDRGDSRARAAEVLVEFLAVS